MTETALDTAHFAMAAAPDDDTARLKFYECLADSELFVLLEREADGDIVEPETIEVEGQTYLLAFDLEERLAEFMGRAAPYAALSGRALAEMLKGEEVGLGLNLDVAPSAALLPAEALDWLTETLAPGPEQAEQAVEELRKPELPDAVVSALADKLMRAAGLARTAWLVAVRYADGRAAHLLALDGAAPGAEAALAKAVNESLVFSGLDEGLIDVTFLPEDSPLAARFARVGLRFDLPMPETPEQVQIPGSAPGLDPNKPPILK